MTGPTGPVRLIEGDDTSPKLDITLNRPGFTGDSIS
jgi:hypothetical protein